MSKIKQTCFGALLFLGLVLPAQAQWSSVISGTSNSLRGVFLLDSGVAYAVGDSGTILKSTDSGGTWSALSSGTTQNLYDVYVFSDTEGVAVGDGGVVRRTTDGGTTWSSVSSGVRDGLRSVSFSGANGICGGLSQDIIYSSDSGASWQVAQSGFFGGGFFGAHMLSPTVGFVTGQNSIFQALEGTTVDGGAHWSFHPFYFDGNEGNADDNFFFDNMTGVSSGVLFDGTGAIARTTNGGVDWTSTLFPQGMQGIDFPQSGSGFTVGFFGTILHSTDMGATWSAQSSGTGLDLYDVRFATDALTGLAVGEGGTILRTTNGGEEGGLELISAVSRKGGFDVELPLTGAPGVECRSDGNSGNQKLILTFSDELAAVDNVATSCGSIHRIRIDERDPHTLRISLRGGVCNGQFVTVMASGVHDDQGHTLAQATVTFGLLLGDVNGNGVVDRDDDALVRADHGTITNETNFREDLDTNGLIERIDATILKSKRGSMLPP